MTPNVADTQHPLVLVVQSEEVDPGAVSADMSPCLPKYRDIMRRIAQDPAGQTVQFELLMRLFLQHVLNVRPQTLDCRRGGSRSVAREWCTDGTAGRVLVRLCAHACLLVLDEVVGVLVVPRWCCGSYFLLGERCLKRDLHLQGLPVEDKRNQLRAERESQCASVP